MNITEVTTSEDRQKFINFPRQFYKTDPVWVPPLQSDLEGTFDRERNPFLDHCKYALFILWRDKVPVGRIAAFIDTLANDHWKEQVGLFGYFDSPNNLAASHILLDTARDWLKAQGMACMRGPWTFVSQEWGAVVEGFMPSPVVMAPYNPPYYGDLLAEYGLGKIKDLLVYIVDAKEGYKVPDRIIELTDKIAQHYAVKVRPLQMNQFEHELEIINELSNASLSNNWGYSPVTEAEVRAMARDLKPVIQPKGVLFAENSQGKPIGFAIAIPDVNVILKKIKGKMFPFGWLQLAWGIPRLRQYRMFALGVIPEYHGKGIDSLLYRGLYESLYTPDIRMEINYVLEDNDQMNNAILKLDARPFRRYRIFQMEI